MPGHVTTDEAAGMLQLAAEGRTQREIAETMGRNLRTVNKTIRAAAEKIARYQAADYWKILGKYHGSLEAIVERACDEYLGAPAGKADPRNAAAAIAAIREDAKLIRLCEFAEKAQGTGKRGRSARNRPRAFGIPAPASAGGRRE